VEKTATGGGMKLGQLEAVFRSEADDATEEYLWTPEEVYEFANDAQREACRRARLLRDSSTTAICQIAVTSSNALYTLDPRVLFVRRAKLASRSRPLVPHFLADMDSDSPGWDTLTGIVDSFLPDYETGKLRLFRIPTANDTLNLTVIRLPLADMADPEADSPEISPAYHRSLVYWMLYRAYSKHDSETRNDKAAMENLAMFEQEFGKRSPAFDEQWIREQYIVDGYTGTT
jgi:hypothetical protein